MTSRTRGLLAAGSLVVALAALQACELLVNPDKLLDDAGAVPGSDATSVHDAGSDAEVATPLDASTAATPCEPVPGQDGGSGLTVCHFTDEVCSASGWCWRSPKPHGREINAMWAEDISAAWVVGEGGIILRASDTNDFESWVVSPERELLGVSGNLGAGKTSVWVVGKGGLALHWDGSRWTASTLATWDLYGVWEDPKTGEVFFAGDEGILSLQLDGNLQLEVATPQVRAIAGADTTVWAVTEGGLILRRSPEGVWSSPGVEVDDAGTSLTSFVSVAASSDLDVWITSATGAVLHWGGVAFERADCGAAVRQIAADRRGGAWVAGGSHLYRVSGTPLSCTGSPTGWGLGVHGAAMLGSKLLLGGELGLMGTAVVDSWDPVFSGKANYPRYVPLSSVWARSASDVWAGGDQGHLYHFDGIGLADKTPANKIPTAITGLSGNGEELVAVSGENIAFQQRSSGAWEGPTPLSCAQFHAVYESPSGLVAAPSKYACDAGAPQSAQLWIRGSDGGLPSPGPRLATGSFGAVDGDGAGTFWVAGTQACKCSETDCECQAGGPSQLNAVAAIPGGSAWAVGQAGAIYTWSAGSWSQAPGTPVTSVHLQGVWAQGPARAWAVGERATILRYEGGSWSKTSTALDPNVTELRGIYGVSGPGGTDVFAVGSYGTLLQLHVP